MTGFVVAFLYVCDCTLFPFVPFLCCPFHFFCPILVDSLPPPYSFPFCFYDTCILLHSLPLCSSSLLILVLFYTHTHIHTRKNMRYFSWVCLTAFLIMMSSCIHFPSNAKISFYLWLKNSTVEMFPHPLICWWAHGLVTLLSYYVLCWFSICRR